MFEGAEDGTFGARATFAFLCHLRRRILIACVNLYAHARLYRAPHGHRCDAREW